ncbi:LytR/AlgR family response regulator transcription factor [Flavobacterium sp. UBA7680]|uniref:LytR/AlgR family response regulator transcription factor n=1 Tax=Flavobacterium sp. UBA7680 TaxID=1946559 RepID=UPI0025BFD3A0|nr:LytTR family DNA-binding domain-containing protein [Flavobacterium sp. UBA7680]
MSIWKDKYIPIFLVLIPICKLINFFITFSEVTYNSALAVAFVIDIIQGYLCWMVIHLIIKKMEKKQSTVHFSISQFLKQVFFTSLGAVVTALIVPDGSVLITGKRYTNSDGSYLLHDLITFLIWILLINFIYVFLRYYDVWKKVEENLLLEKTLKTEGLTIKIGDKNIKVALTDIHGFYVENGFTFLINSGFKTFIVESSLDKLEERLPERYFFRVNRKFILHRNAIVSFKRIEDNKLLITTLSEKPLPIELSMSRLKAPAFKKWFELDTAL